MKKKIYVCPKCGSALNFSSNPMYTFHCERCDMLWHNYEAKEVEQPRMEGIVDYTDLARASMEIKSITDKAIAESTKQIEIKGEDIVEQIAEYINETIHPILSSGLYTDRIFQDNARIYSRHFKLSFGEYLPYGKSYQAHLFGDNGMLRVFFNRNGEYAIEAQDSKMLLWLVEEWATLKDSMKRMIAYGIQECDKANQNKLKKQEELSNVINNFRL